MSGIAGKVMLVTGASSGIGTATAIAARRVEKSVFHYGIRKKLSTLIATTQKTIVAPT